MGANLSSLLFPSTSTNNNTTEQSNSTSTIATTSTTNSSQSPPFPSVEYEAFLSFRGPDTRGQITDILYRFLVRSKIHTFKDDDELRKGEGIWSALVKAIAQSKIYIPILSENYAHSKWCLKEIAEIVERRRQDSRRIILPIFYMVDPRDVRHQAGPYLKAFQQHEKNFDWKTVRSWKDALNEVGALKGWHVKSNNEQVAIADEVSSIIWSHLSKDNSTLYTDELVGIDDQVEVVVEKLSLQANNVTMVGIHGIGGIGKTTIAKAVYNKISSSFEHCCFIEDIRTTQEHKDGVVVLQKKLISEILKMDQVVFNGDSEGRKIIRERVGRFKILVILDDVDEKFKFEDILGSPADFEIGSRFIGTSRNIKVLSALNDYQCRLYEVGAMSQSCALELFCKHAFKKNSPPPSYKNITDGIVSTAGGLPLTLKVIGSLLFMEEMAVWEEKLELLRETPELEVMDRLKISYDTLPYKAQQIFLDIACYFIGRNKEMPCYMWNDCKYYPASNINILVQRSMIKLGENDEFHMHDQLRDMGKEIVRQEQIENPWMTSRICYDSRDSLELLIDKKGTDRVKALRVISSQRKKSGVLSFASYGPRKEFESECFMGLSRLRYLDTDYTSLTGDFRNLLPNLRWIELHNHEDGNRPMTNFYMKKMVILDLRDSAVTDDWGGWNYLKMADNLKVLDLAGCTKLRTIPLFPQSGSLEILDLSLHLNPSRYVDVDQYLPAFDIDKLKKLKVLKLAFRNIKTITGGTIGTMKMLRELDMTNFRCDNLREALADIGELSSLKILKGQGARMVTRWHILQEEVLEGVELPHKSLKALETSSPVPNLTKMSELEELSIDCCYRGLDIPSSNIGHGNEGVSVWWKVSKLKKLKLSGTRLNGGGTTNDRQEFLLPSSLVSLHVNECPNLVWLPNLDNLENLIRLYIFECPGLEEIQLGHVRLKSLQTLEITPSRLYGNLTRIHGLAQLMFSSDCKLQKLHLVACHYLTWDYLSVLIHHQHQHNQLDDDQTVVGITIETLEYLCIHRCPQLQVGPMLESYLLKLPRLRELEVGDALLGSKKLELTGIVCMEQLKELKLYKFPTERIASLSKLQNLRSIEISDVPNLREIVGLGDLKSLEILKLESCPSLERLWHEDRQLPKLRILEISGARNLREIVGLGELPSLTNLSLYGCPSLERLWPEDQQLDSLKKMWRLQVSGCKKVTDAHKLSNLKRSLPNASIDWRDEHLAAILS